MIRGVSLAPADWLVLIGYLLAMAAIGIIVGLKVKDTEHYFLGRRRFSKWLMIGQSFGQGTHAEMPVSLVGAVYSVGASGIWYQWKNLFATPFYWVMAPVFRRIRRTTLAEMSEDRYGPWMGHIYTVFALSFFTINTASMLKGAGKVINQATGGQLGVDAVILGMTAVFIAYSFIGGLVASAWTDFFQGFLIIALSFMLIPPGLSLVGGMDGLREALAPHQMSLATPQGIGPWVIAVLTLNGLIGIMAQPHMLAAVGTGEDERACRVGFMGGNFVKRFCTVGWGLVGLVVVAAVAQGSFGPLEDPEDAFGLACRQLLFPGALGLLVASILAANMSTNSAFMVDSGALFTESFYRKLVADRGDRHYLWVGRFSGFLITMVGVLYALFLIERVLYSFLLTETMATYMGISFLGGIVWRRANRYGALASLLTALGANFLLYYLRDERLDHWNPWVFLGSLAAGVVALVLVSLLTAPEPEEARRSFYDKLQTPTDPGAGSSPREVAEAGQQSLLVNLLHPVRGAAGVGFLRAYGEDLKGFAIGCAVAAGLVLGTWLLLQ
jgi:Na+/proline symporter